MRAARTRATVRHLWRLVRHPTALGIATTKAAVAITLCMILVFINGFSNLSQHPIALNSVRNRPARPAHVRARWRAHICFAR